MERKSELNFDPLTEVKCYDDLKKFPHFEDEWLRGGPISRWIPKGYEGRPVYVFETGGTTGIPKSRMVIEDHRIDYEIFSDTLPDKYFPKGTNWLMLGPSGPRRLRLAVEHLCQYRGGICFCIDLDPRWVVKLLKRNQVEEANLYKQHCIDQAVTILTAGHDVKCMFATPKLLECTVRLALEDQRNKSCRRSASKESFPAAPNSLLNGHVSASKNSWGGPVEEGGIYMTPTYGNTLMGLACSKPVTAADRTTRSAYYAPQPRAVTEVVQFDDYDHSRTAMAKQGRVKLYNADG